MHKSQIEVGGVYTAKVRNDTTTVRVDRIDEAPAHLSKRGTCYYVTNLNTGRKNTFTSVARFISEVKSAAKVKEEVKSQESVGAAVKTKAEAAYPEHLKEIEVESYTTCPDCDGGFDDDGNRCDTCQGKGEIEEVEEEESERTTPISKKSGLAAKLNASKSTSLPPHVIVKARAGTGKTTTLVEGLKAMKGLPTKVVPSPQQKAIWDTLNLSKDARSVCFVAFNKGIATELQERVPNGCEAMTMHSLGFRAVQKAFGRPAVSSYVVGDLVAEHLETSLWDLRKEKPGMVPAVEELVSKCKMNLVEDPSVEQLMQLAAHFSIEMGSDAAEILSLVPTILKLCRNPKGKINFDDMIWLAVIHNLAMTKYDLLLVDEAQDLNRAQQSLARMSGRRIVMVGDDKQAIYGFAGADVESMDRMTEELKADANGCEVYPLTVTRRCGRVIVKEVNKIVEDFQAHESNGEGMVSEDVIADNGYRPKAQGGDMVLCRVNAPLVRECFLFLRAGKRANIQGRDIGQGLISLVKKLMPDENDRLTTGSIVPFCSELSEWRDNEVNKEQQKKNPNENRILAIEDKADCLACFTENIKTVAELIGKIETLFTDDRKVPGIRLSSIHKAKGLEANRVFFLMPKGGSCPHPMARKQWAIDQEYNLLYVGITRAINHLIFVRDAVAVVPQAEKGR